MMPNEETNNLKKIAVGDHDAFRSIFMKYYPKIKYFIAHIIKSETIAEELSQDIFLRIWENREDMLKIRSFNAYMYRTAKNSALNYLEHKFVEESYIANYSQHMIINPEGELDAKELEFLVQLAVGRMPEQRRKIYIMSRVENLEKEEIAEKLKLTKKTVENQLSLALKDIRKILSLAVVFFI
jgi:RNA polymerase sigma-70 factor (ECF subfamily)